MELAPGTFRVHEIVISEAELEQLEALEAAEFGEAFVDASRITTSIARPNVTRVCDGGCYGSGIVEATGLMCRRCRGTGDMLPRPSDRIRASWGLRR